MPEKINLLWSDDSLTIYPTNKKIEKFLSYQLKELVEVEVPTDRGSYTKNVLRSRKQKAFRECETRKGAITTMPGFCRSLAAHLHEEGHEVFIEDLRIAKRPPNLDNMFGFRYNQQQLLTDFLVPSESGLLGAPTRYGKTYLILNTLRAYSGLTTVVTAPGVDLVDQLYKDIKEAMPHREVKMIGGPSRVKFPSEDITVISMDSLDKADFGRTELLIIDEPHASVTTTRLPILNKFNKALRLGFGATLTGRFDGKDKLIEGLIGPVLVERTYKEAVAEGAICPLRVYMMDIKIHKHEIKTGWNRNTAYKNLMLLSGRIAGITRKICHDLLPKDWQSLIFIQNEKQADNLLKYIGEEGTIAMAKKFKNKTEREEFMELMKDDTLKRCLASNIYGQGVTFNHVRAMINNAAGGNNTMTIQKPGRLAEVRPNKKIGVIFDFFFMPGDGLSFNNVGKGVKMLFIDSVNRRKAYEEKGYEIIHVRNFEELRSSFELDCV